MSEKILFTVVKRTVQFNSTPTNVLFTSVPGISTGIKDAPIDGERYIRSYGEWILFNGNINWITSSINVTAVAFNGYFIDTTFSEKTVQLPIGVKGATISICDWKGTAKTNRIVISANGTEKIMGLISNLYLNEDNKCVTLIYSDNTQGWKITSTNQINI